MDHLLRSFGLKVFSLSLEAPKTSSIAHHAFPIICILTYEVFCTSNGLLASGGNQQGALRPGTRQNPPFARPRPGDLLSFRNHVYASYLVCLPERVGVGMHTVHHIPPGELAMPEVGGFALSDDKIRTSGRWFSVEV